RFPMCPVSVLRLLVFTALRTKATHGGPPRPVPALQGGTGESPHSTAYTANDVPCTPASGLDDQVPPGLSPGFRLRRGGHGLLPRRSVGAEVRHRRSERRHDDGEGAGIR